MFMMEIFLLSMAISQIAGFGKAFGYVHVTIIFYYATDSFWDRMK
jgi:hypothetical protein